VYENNSKRIEMGLTEIRDYEAVAQVYLAQDRDMCWCLVNTVMSLGFLNGRKFLD
jgi:hypothetical protein